MSLQSVHARSIYDSRGNPTVEVDIHVKGHGLFRAAVPSGASTGSHEAVELRDGDPTIHLGKGVTKAVSNVNDIIGPALLAQNFNLTDQRKIDEFMCKLDGTSNKSKLGANAILGVSIAVCKAGAAIENIPLYQYIAKLAGYSDVILPVPSFNIINGGSHAGNRLAVQEFMIMPTGAKTFREAMRIGSEVYHTLKGLIKKKYGIDACNVGDEGGFAPNIQDSKDALDLIIAAIDKAGYTKVVSICMDVAASEFLKDGKYHLDFKNPKESPDSVLSFEQLLDFYTKVMADHPQLVSIEDPFGEEEFQSFAALTALAEKKGVQIVGDDLTVTSTDRIRQAIDSKACNALLLKLNQNGSVSQSIDACAMSRAANWGIMVSHRSGETEDNFIADFSVGICAGQIKTGAPCRSERLAKYNQLLRIEEELGSSAKFAGRNFRHPI